MKQLFTLFIVLSLAFCVQAQEIKFELTHPDPKVCAGAEFVEFPYTTEETAPLKYIIRSEAAFLNMEDFIDLPPSPLVVSIPNLLETGTYTGTLIVMNQDSVESDKMELSVTLFEPFSPGAIEAASTEIELCAEVPHTISGKTPTGGDGNYAYQWKVKVEGEEEETVIEDAVEEKYSPPVNKEGVFTFTRWAKDASCAKEFVPSEGEYVLTVVAKKLPIKPEKPDGEKEPCSSDEKTLYSITNNDCLAQSFKWMLDPQDAGYIASAENTTAYINWNQDFAGDVKLFVYAVNSKGESPASEALNIFVKKGPKTTFINPPHYLCGNQKGVDFEVTELKDCSYEWSVTNINAEIKYKDNTAVVDFPKVNEGVICYINAKTTSEENGCSYLNRYPLEILNGNTPDLLNKIVPKTRNATPHILIYPNPKGDYGYQWYENDTPVPGATEQFYYPGRYDGRTLQQNTNYKVFVYESNSLHCGRFTEDFTTGDFPICCTPSFTVSPNPAKDQLRITIYELRDDVSNNIDVEITDIYGKKQLSIVNCQLSINVINISSLQPGFYFITLTINNQKITEKFIVQK